MLYREELISFLPIPNFQDAAMYHLKEKIKQTGTCLIES